MNKFTNEEKRAEAAREVAMRRRVYGSWRTLTHADQRRIELMQEIESDYSELAAKERLI